MQQLSQQDLAALQELEESLWREDTRFDSAYMEAILAPDFREFGRSGRKYDRAATLSAPRSELSAAIPLPNLQIQPISQSVVLVTYDSRVRYQGEVADAHRSSLWSRASGSWRLHFHQGTPF